MARTLTDIQTGARFHARDNNLSLVSEEGLALANRVYRRLALSLQWPEFLVEDVTLTTVAATDTYTWPTSAPASILAVEAQGTHNGGTQFGSGTFGTSLFGAGDESYRPITEPPNERAWADAGKEPDSDWPWYYRRTREGAADQLEIRPAPLSAGKGIRIRGMAEPTEFTAGTDQTQFIDSVADDALEKLIAAEYSVREGFTDVVAAQRQEANDLLSQLFNFEVKIY